MGDRSFRGPMDLDDDASSKDAAVTRPHALKVRGVVKGEGFLAGRGAAGRRERRKSRRL